MEKEIFLFTLGRLTLRGDYDIDSCLIILFNVAILH